MLKWFSLSRWENYCLIAMASVAFLLVVALRSEAHVPVPLEATPRASEPRWLARHRAITEKAAAGSYDVVLLGDSITQGWEYNAAVWQAHFPGVRALNAGISSDRVEHVLWRTEHGLFATSRPKVVVLLAGINNLALASAAEIADGLSQTIHAIERQSPDSKILVLALFPSGKDVNNPRRARIQRVNDALTSLSDPGRVAVVDIGDTFLAANGTLTKQVSFDSLHLTRRGYELWAQALDKPLKALLAL